MVKNNCRWAEEAEQRNLDAVTATEQNVESKLWSQYRRLVEFPTAADYLSGFLAAISISQRTLTDADGKFSITCPRDKEFTLFATAQRSVPSEYGAHTEEYYWLVDTSAVAENTQLLLNNNNLWHPPTLNMQP
jgi:hypothetical protein